MNMNKLDQTYARFREITTLIFSHFSYLCEKSRFVDFSSQFEAHAKQTLHKTISATITQDDELLLQKQLTFYCSDTTILQTSSFETSFKIKISNTWTQGPRSHLKNGALLKVGTLLCNFLLHFWAIWESDPIFKSQNCSSKSRR